MTSSSANESPKVTRSEVLSEVTAEGVKIERFTVFSPSMQRDIRVVVVLPPAYLVEGDEAAYPILYTLHGRGAPHDTWASMSRLRAQLKNKPFIYTCFDADNASYYLDAEYPIRTARGKVEPENDPPKSSKFTTFFFDEFLPAIDAWYRVDPKARGVTGFSMGGSGEMTYMLRRPEMFCAVSGLSSAFLDSKDLESKPMKGLLENMGSPEEFPERYKAVDHYLQIEKQLEAGTKLPPLYQHIGTEDFLLDMNRKFKTTAEATGLDLTYRESPGGHNWAFWHSASVGVAEFHWKHFQKARQAAE